MKKLFALAIVGGMMFVSCGTKTPETEPETEAVEEEVVVNDEETPAADMPEEVAEEVAE